MVGAMAYLHKQKRDGVWFLIDKSKKPSWIKLGKISHAEAKQVLKKYEMESTYLRLDLPLPPSKISFKELSEEYLADIKGIKAPYTVDREKHFLDHFCKTFGQRMIHELTARLIEDYLVAKFYKPRSWRNIVLCLRAVYKLAIDRKYLPENPMLKIRLPKIGKSLPRFVDPEILDRVIDHMNGPIKIYYMILRYTGMRPGEALSLQVKNIREVAYRDRKTKKEKKKLMFQFKASKTSTDRVIPIHPNLISMVKELTKNKKPENYLFPNKNGEGHQKSMKMGLRRAIDRSGVQGISMYTFRHSVATDMLAKTGDLRAVQTILGHSRSTTTEIYAHALEAAKIDAIEAL